DDPGFTYSATWDMARAKQADLLGKANWRRYPAAMLKARAISECARDACQEVLIGIRYTPDELGAADDGGEVLDDGHRRHPDGSVDIARASEDEKVANGFMGSGQRVEQNDLRRMGEPAPGSVLKMTEPDPDDPWLTQAPAAAQVTPAPGAAVETPSPA